MSELTARIIATEMSLKARALYEADGFVTPLVELLDVNGSGVMMMPNAQTFDGQPREQFGALLMAVGRFVDAAFIIAVTEAWMKAFPHDAEPDDIPRGYLQAHADTDPTVETVIMVNALDLRDKENSYSIMAKVEGDPRKFNWKVDEMPGVMPGALIEAMIAGHRAGCMGAAEIIFPPEQGLHERLQTLAEMGQLSAAMVTTVEPDERNN